MNRIPAFILFLCFLLLQFGCSGTSSDNSNLNSNRTDAEYAAQFTEANAALEDGSRLLDSGDTDKAIEVLSRAVELNPDLADAYFKLGIAYALVETRDAAIVEEQITPTPLPGDPKPKRKKTNSEKAFEKAVAAYKKQIEANPEDDAAYFNLGRAYNKLNEDEDAAKAFRQAVKLKPDDTEYQTDLGAIFIKLAQYREAIGPLKKAVELDPENSRASDLLEDAEAGRQRIDFIPPKKDDSNSNSANTNTNSNTEIPNTNAAPKPKPTETKESKETKVTASPKKPN